MTLTKRFLIGARDTVVQKTQRPTVERAQRNDGPWDLFPAIMDERLR